MSWRAARSRIAPAPSPAGVSVRAPDRVSPGEADVDDPPPERREDLEGFRREVDDLVGCEGSTVVDYHDHAPSGRYIGHGHHRPEGQPRVRRGQTAPRRVVPPRPTRLHFRSRT